MLRERHCKPVRRGSPPLDSGSCQQLLPQLDSDRTMTFANAVAWIAHREDHHPGLQIAYNRCRVSYPPHTAGGLTENDFICAAHIDPLLPAA